MPLPPVVFACRLHQQTPVSFIPKCIEMLDVTGCDGIEYFHVRVLMTPQDISWRFLKIRSILLKIAIEFAGPKTVGA